MSIVALEDDDTCLAFAQEGESDASGHHSDYYENDDGFIDDTEVHEFFGGDWHKPKYSGFFINQVMLH